MTHMGGRSTRKEGEGVAWSPIMPRVVQKGTHYIIQTAPLLLGKFIRLCQAVYLLFGTVPGGYGLVTMKLTPNAQHNP
jgi:hypothetical protein